MACREAFIEYITEQLSGAGSIVCKKMFGDYGIYCDGKIFGLVCDDVLYIKDTEAGRSLIKEPRFAPPYDGARPYIVAENIDDREAVTQLVRMTCLALPDAKPKKKKKQAE